MLSTFQTGNNFTLNEFDSPRVHKYYYLRNTIWKKIANEENICSFSSQVRITGMHLVDLHGSTERSHPAWHVTAVRRIHGGNHSRKTSSSIVRVYVRNAWQVWILVRRITGSPSRWPGSRMIPSVKIIYMWPIITDWKSPKKLRVSWDLFFVFWVMRSQSQFSRLKVRNCEDDLSDSVNLSDWPWKLVRMKSPHWCWWRTVSSELPSSQSPRKNGLKEH